MPDEHGTFKGTGWSRASEAAYERVFGNAATQRCPNAGRACFCTGRCLEARPVPTQPSPEVEHLADRTAAEADGWEPDYEDLDRRRQEARDERW